LTSLTLRKQEKEQCSLSPTTKLNVPNPNSNPPNTVLRIAADEIKKMGYNFLNPNSFSIQE